MIVNVVKEKETGITLLTEKAGGVDDGDQEIGGAQGCTSQKPPFPRHANRGTCVQPLEILTPFVQQVVNILNQSGGMKVMDFMLSDVVACVMSLKSLDMVVGDNRGGAIGRPDGSGAAKIILKRFQRDDS